jgi:hypothetical protein
MIDGEEQSIDDILGASLSDAYDAAQTAEPGADDAAAAAPSAPADGRVRDDQGRFAAKTDTGEPAQGATAAAAPAAPNTDQGSKPGDGAAPAAAAALVPSDAPASWSAAEKAHWKTLPPDVQQAIARREAEFAAGIEQKTQGFKALNDVIAPRSEMLRRTYGTVENGIKELLGLSDYAVTQPADFVKWFVHQHRLNPQELFAGAPANGAASQQPGPDGATPADPLAAVQAQIEEIRAEARQIAAAPIIAKAKTDLQKFEAEAATKHPHYANPKVRESIRQTLLQAASSGEDDMTYEQAYERVVWSLPELRQQLIEAETKAALEKQSAAQAEAARKARATAGPQLRSVGTPQGVQAGKTSIDQTLSDVYDRATGAA